MSRPQHVTATSVAALRNLQAAGADLSQKERIARAILANTRAGKRSWIAQLARELSMRESSVSARLNELSKDGAIELDGLAYTLDVQSPVWDKATRRWSIVDPVTGQRAKSYALVLPVKAGEQAALFE